MLRSNLIINVGYGETSLGSWRRIPESIYFFGDFNAVRGSNERWGCSFSQKEADDFNGFIEEAELLEVEMGGFAYTRVSPAADKMSRIDRFLVTECVIRRFPNLAAVALSNTISDHRPICLKDSVVDFGPRPFRFFNSWMHEPSFQSLLCESWGKHIEEDNAAIRLKNKFKRLKDEIKGWWRTVTHERSKEKVELQNQLKEIDDSFDNGGPRQIW